MIAAIFAVYSVITTANYRQHRIAEVSGLVAFESERVSGIISEMERNAIDLALAGRQFYLSKDFAAGATSRQLIELGISISVENFSAFTAAVGGGIWFEPYALIKDTRRLCFYAFFDPAIGVVRHDPEFESDEYDYHNQMWYTAISSGLADAASLAGSTVLAGGHGRHHSIVWTQPYFDDAGTNAFMTTVGAGIYDNSGSLVGISTVDWEIQSMVDRLSAIKPTNSSFVLLASLKDDFIISKTRENSSAFIGASLDVLSWFNDLRFTEGDTVETGYFTDAGVEFISFSRMFDNGWLFSIQIPVKEIFAEIQIRNNQFTIIIVILFITLLIVTGLLLSRIINRPLYQLTSGVAELGSGNLDKQIQILSHDEFGTLASAFNKMTIDLKKSIEQNLRERTQKERIDAELNVATQIQVNMLPRSFPAFPYRNEFDIYAMMQPAREVGGDFYDYFLIDKNTLAVVMADVSGKGVPAALFMVIARTLIKNTALSGKRPEVVFGIVNRMLCENNETGMFVTAFLGYLDIPSGLFTFVNAGHNPPLLYLGDQFNWLKLKPELVLAGMEDTFYHQHKITLKQGDKLFLYTDGITEAMNNKKELFSDNKLLETANNFIDRPLKDFTMSVKQEIDKFGEGAEQADDITMLILQYKGAENNESKK